MKKRKYIACLVFIIILSVQMIFCFQNPGFIERNRVSGETKDELISKKDRETIQGPSRVSFQQWKKGKTTEYVVKNLSALPENREGSFQRFSLSVRRGELPSFQKEQSRTVRRRGPPGVF